MSLLADVAIGVGGYMVGWTNARLTRRRPQPPIPDPSLSAACPACGGEWGSWSAVKYEKEATRFEQRRACADCGRSQRRHVPRD